MLGVALKLAEPVAAWQISEVGRQFTGRRVEVDRVDLDFFRSRFTVDQLRLFDRQEKSLLLFFDRFRVEVDSLALLDREIRVEGLELTSPRLFLARLQEDNFNFSDIVHRLVGPRDKNKSRDPIPEKKEKEAGLSGFALRNINLNNFSLLFLDKAAGEELKFTIEDFSFFLTEFDLTRFDTDRESQGHFGISGRFLKSPLRISGKIITGKSKFRVETELKLDGLDLRQSAPYWEYLAYFRLARGKLDVKARHEFELAPAKEGERLEVSRHRLSGNITLNSARLVNETVAGGVISLGRTTLNWEDYDIKNQTGTLQSVEVDRPRLTLIRHKNGRLNLSRFFRLRERKEAAESGKAKEENGPDKKAREWSWLLKKARVNQARVSFRDDKAGLASQRIRLSYLNIRDLRSNPAYGFRLGGEFSLRPNLTGIPGGGKKTSEKETRPVRGGLEGTIWRGGSLSLNLEWKELPLLLSRPYFVNIGYSVGRGNTSGAVHLEKHGAGVKVSGNVKARNTVFYHHPAEKKPVEIFRFKSVDLALKNFRQSPGGEVSLEVDAQTDLYSSARVSGKFHPGRKEVSGLKVKLKNQELSRFNYYVRGNSAYRVVGGTLNLDADLKYTGGRGGVTGNLSVRNPKMETVNPEHPHRLPVSISLALDLLQDKDKRIPVDLNIPLSSGQANLDNLQKTVVGFVFKFLGKAIILPFKKVAKLTFAGDQIEKIDFYPVTYPVNKAVLGAEQKEILKNLGAFLSERPGLRLAYLSRGDYTEEYGLHPEKQKKIIKVKVKKKVPVVTNPVPGPVLNTEMDAEPEPGTYTAETNPEELGKETPETNGEGLDTSPDTTADQAPPTDSANGKKTAGSNAKAQKFKWVEVEEEKIKWETVMVPNQKPDVSHLSDLIEKRNFATKQFLVKEFKLEPTRLVLRTAAPGDTGKMTAARTEFRLP